MSRPTRFSTAPPGRSSASLRRRVSRRGLLRGSALAGVGATALSLGGCGDGDAASRRELPDIDALLENVQEPTRALAPAQPSEGEPEQGGTLRTHAALDLLDFFDIHRSRFATTQLFSALQQSKLLRYADIDAGLLEPDLATIPELPDETTYIIELQPGVTWWDREPTNGRPFTAEDVRANFERQIAGVDAAGAPDPLFQRQQQYLGITRLDVVEERVLVISTEQPDATFLGPLLAGPWSFMQAPEAWELAGDAPRDEPPQASDYSGTGPFQIGGFQQERSITFFRNPNYVRAGLPWLQRIELQHMIDAAAQADAYMNGELDLWSPADPLDLEPLLPELPDHRIGERFLPFPIQFAFSLEEGSALNPFRDPRIAQAVHLALDRAAILAFTYGDFGRLSGPAAPFALGWTMEQAELAETPGYRCDKSDDIGAARTLLSAAGFSDPVPIAVPDIFEATYPGIGALLHDTLAANLGLPVEVSTLGLSEIIAGLPEGQPAATLGWGESAVDPDPTADLLRLVHSEGRENRGRLRDASIDAGIDRMRATLEPEARQRIFREEVQPLLLERPSWLVNVGIGVQRSISRPSIHLPRFGYAWDGHHFEQAWIEGAGAT